MAGAGESGLPKWAEPYLPDFRRILHAVEMSDGFVLFPIEVPGPDVAEALAHWIEKNGHPCKIIAGPWSNVVPALFAEKSEAGKVVMLIGEIANRSRMEERMFSAMRLLNQRRDVLAQQLAMPLLWCGSRQFLDLTWQLAPDFWSVADVPHRIERKVVREPPPRVSTLQGVGRSNDLVPNDDDLAFDRDAFELTIRRNDDREAVRYGQRLIESLCYRSAFVEARKVAERLEERLQHSSDSMLLSRVKLSSGKLLFLMGDLEDAEVAISKAIELSPSSQEAADAKFVLGTIYAAMDRSPEATDAYNEALKFYSSRYGDFRKHADVLVALGDCEAKLEHIEEAESRYEAALSTYARVPGDQASEAGRANALLALGELYVSTSRMREADEKFGQALAIYDELKIQIGTANALLARGRLYSLLDRVDEARKSYEAALQILRKSGLPQWVDTVTRELKTLPPR